MVLAWAMTPGSIPRINRARGLGMVEGGEALREFLIESQENLERLDQELIAMERGPVCPDAVDDVFRVFHTLKGTCGFFDFPRLEATAHAGENLLGDLREASIPWDGAVTNALLELVEAIRRRLDSIEQSGREPEAADARLIARIETLRHPDAGRTAPGADEANGSVEVPEEAQGVKQGEGTIRVDVAQLDTLMDLVGELVLARNRLDRLTSGEKATPLQGAVQRLSVIASELQDGVMRARMQPIGGLWGRFPRLVRDLGVQCGKRVTLEMSGESTALDKAILEAIKDPLTHLIRNAVDHGIESADRRLAVGKTAEGRVTLRAFHEGGMVHIEIEDDGGGIDSSRIRERAVERRLIGAEQAALLSDRDALRLIFRPGFSTAETVTSVSGRGVGMDVVKTNVERVGGTVDLRSEPGQGTTFQVKIPLTLAIIPALIVSCRGERYAIPQVSLLELVRLETDDSRDRIEWVEGVPLYRLRGELLSVVDLGRVLGEAAGDGGSSAGNLVVLQADDRRYGLIVDGVVDTEEIVVKPLARQLKSLSVFSGTTIMGDGRVALILDVVGIARESGMGTRNAERPVEVGGAKESEAESYLLVAGGDGRRFAMPLSCVSRLEVFEGGAVESTMGGEVIQYRGELLPLTRLPGGSVPGPGGGEIRVVVASDAGRQVGVVVDQIVDIVKESARASELGGGPSIVGTAVLQQRATDLLDVPKIIRGGMAATGRN